MQHEIGGRLVAMELPGRSGAPRAIGVPAHLAAQWQTTLPELLNRAVANTMDEQLDIAAHEYGEGARMYTIGRGDLVGAPHLLRLDEVLGLDLPNGAFVIVPKVNAVCVLPLLKAADVSLLGDMLTLLHEVGAGAPSLDAFWFHDGRLDPLNVQVKHGRLERIFPPDAFKEMMARLPQ